MFRDFKNFNIDVFEKELSAIDWSLATQNYFNENKKNSRAYGKGLMKLSILKRLTKQRAHTLY